MMIRRIKTIALISAVVVTDAQYILSSSKIRGSTGLVDEIKKG
jgi:hypothetical protein